MKMQSPSVKAAHGTYKKSGRDPQRRRIALRPHTAACRKLDFDMLCDTDTDAPALQARRCLVFEQVCRHATGLSYMEAIAKARLFFNARATEKISHRRARVAWSARLYCALIAIPSDQRSRCCNALIEMLEPMTFWDGVCADVTEGCLLLIHLRRHAYSACR